MGRISTRRSRRAVAVVTLAGLFASTATAAHAIAPGEVPPELLLPAGRYVVVLDEPAAATYEGGEAGLRRTAPGAGDTLDTNDPAVKEYVAHLENVQHEVAASVDATPAATYQVTLNGFSAQLSGAQASKLASQRGVKAVYPDAVLHTNVAKSTDFMGLSGDDGTWATQLGGVGNAGAGIVVGVIDTGISPQSPSFAGDALSTTPGAEPYLEGDTIVFDKSDGTQFRSQMVTGEAWDASDYNTKLIGAQYFADGANAAGWFDRPTSTNEFASPRDWDGHGTHTASTAAGNHGVAAAVNGYDYGDISGVAPAAKVAAYKACYSGDLLDLRTDDICATSDLLAAINAAVSDGVDVINFSIGGGAATSVVDVFDEAFFNAAAAGVFVSVSAGNDGPGTSTLDHASPWYTTVANSTMTSETATLTLGDGAKAAGLTIGLPDGLDLADKGIAWSRLSGVSGADATLLAQCQDNTLDPALTTGKIVVCDRGGNFLYQKADEVKRAGGIATIILNTPESAQTVFGGSYSTPTVHVPSQFFDAITGYISATAEPVASLTPGNETTWVAPASPAVNASSSRGPALAGGSDVLKPDVAAPGTDVLAAVANGVNADPEFNFLTGTSMAAPQVAGLGALYLGAHPNATPAEVKSAIMTTAFDTVYEDGTPDTDPFDQGAGQVDGTRFLNPGAVYLNGPADWLAYIQGTGELDLGVEPIDPSDLNLASISIGSLGITQTVTRTLTAVAPGTYEASVSVPGVDAQVSPSTIEFANAGDSVTFTVTLTPTTAAKETWTTGFLTWTGPTTVRSPIAVYPVTAQAPTEVAGSGITGSVDVPFTPALTGELPLVTAGLVQPELLTDPEFDVPGHTGDQDSFYDEDGQFNNYFIAEVPEGTMQARFQLDETHAEGSGEVDLDLAVYIIEGNVAYPVGSSATVSGDELVVVNDPDPGLYYIIVNRYSHTTPFTWDLTTTNLVPGVGEGSFTATPNPVPVTGGVDATYTASWTGLEPETTYYAMVQYGDSAVRTLVTVESGQAAPVATKAPKVTGSPTVGKTLKTTTGTWDPKKVSTSIQWLRDGTPIEGATGASYRVAKADIGTSLSVRVTATAAGNPNAGVADSNAVFVKYTSSTSVSMNRYLGTSSQSYEASIVVTPSGGPAATGTVKLSILGGPNVTATLVDGRATVKLPKQRAGIKVVIATYSGSDTVDPSTGLSGFIVLW